LYIVIQTTKDFDMVATLNSELEEFLNSISTKFYKKRVIKLLLDEVLS